MPELLAGLLLTTFSIIPLQNELRAHSAKLTEIQNNELVAVSSAQGSMLNEVTDLETTASGVPGQINSLITTLETTQTDLQNNGETIVKNV